MATPRQVSVLQLHARLCKRFMSGGTNPATPSTLKHRAELGATTSVGHNYHYEGAAPFTVLPTTTDTQVWAVWEPEKVRSTSQEGGDTAAGRERQQRFRGQMPVLDVNGVAFVISDEDWLLAPDGVTLIKIENPVLDPTGSIYSFSGVAQE